jgi:uncharacterized membrane protein YeaQ/YmgE (transglycosylase-associated protein family)
MPALIVANIALEPGGALGWIIVGLIAGAIAGRIVEGRGLGCLGDILVGVVGAFVGSFILGLFNFTGTVQFWGSLVVAFFGAVVFLLVIKLIVGRRSRGL